MSEERQLQQNKPEDVLRDFFERNGCIRVRPDDPEKGRHGGVELRFVVNNMPERRSVLAALKALDIGHGKVYRKQKGRKQWVVPVYGKGDVVSFLRLVKPNEAEELLKRVIEAGRKPIKTND